MNNMIGNRRSGKQVYYALNGAVDVDPAGRLHVDVENYSLQIGERLRKPVSTN
jgi:hypothetical protein